MVLVLQPKVITRLTGERFEGVHLFGELDRTGPTGWKSYLALKEWLFCVTEKGYFVVSGLGQFGTKVTVNQVQLDRVVNVFFPDVLKGIVSGVEFQRGLSLR